MKKFKFSLNKVLDFNKQNIDVEKNEYFQIKNELQKIEDSITECENLYCQMNDELNSAYKVGIQVGKIVVYKTYQNEIIEKIKNLKIKKSDVIKRLEKKMEQIIELKKAIASLEKLEENQKKEYNKKESKANETMINEMICNSIF